VLMVRPTKKLAATLFFLTSAFCVSAPAAAEQERPPVSPAQPRQNEVAALGPVNDLSPLLRQHPAGGEGLAEKIADILARDPGAAPAVANLGNGCNCDQATAIALGVARATTRLQASSPDALKSIYQSFAESCSGCRRRIIMGPLKPEDLRCERDPARQRLADVLKVRAPLGKDCLCALLSSLAAQAFAQGLGGPIMGFFPDEGGFIGGGIGIFGFKVSDN
ncbi:MAG: hypothetical protein N2444_07235, partial [Methylocystis sp.]|nr:hypothetical protein [Methylocystis sp.]